MSLPSTRNIIIALAFLAVCGVAVAGWMRKTDRLAENSFVMPQGNPTSVPLASQVPLNSQYADSQTAYSANAVAQQPVYSSDGYYPSRMRPIYIRQQDAEIQPAPINQVQECYIDSRGHRRGRSKTHSVEIVAGTAAVGAAIGAIAGGGKGAAIGALSGGGAGFVYDRVTHKH